MSEENFRKAWETIVDDLEEGEIYATYKGKQPTPEAPNLSAWLRGVADSQNHSKDTEDKNIDKNATIAFAEVAEEETSTLASVNFKIVQEIARGGMGAIFSGHQHSLQREVAIKKLLNNNSPSKRKRFIAEAIVTAYLDHPNIVPIYELGLDDNKVILAMKLVKGVSWKQLLHPEEEEHIKQAQKYDLEGHLNILLQVCNAVDFAHSKGIVHCDLKPGNIMIGEFGETLVMDWGLAIDIRDIPGSEKHALHKTTVRSPMGTPCYFSPELATGDGPNIGPWTDVYLLGAILYEILMGKGPHQQETLWMTIWSACQGKLPPFSPSVPKELKQICCQAMAKNPQDRYQSIAEFRVELQNFLQHRESVLIARQAKETLDSCEQSISLQTTASSIIERHKLYGKFAQAIAGFQQALQLWPENPTAAHDEYKARLLYAKEALLYKDFGVVEVQLEFMDAQREETKGLQKALVIAREQRHHDKITRGLLQIGMGNCLAFPIIFVGLAIFYSIYGKFPNGGLQPAIVGVILLAISIVAVYVVHISKKFTCRELLFFSGGFEITGAFLLSVGFFSVSIVPETPVTGFFWSCVWMLLFRIEVAHTVVSTSIAAFLAATAGVSVMIPFLDTMSNIMILNYVGQHYLIAILGTIAVARIAHTIYD